MSDLQATIIMAFGGLLALVGVSLVVLGRTAGANRIRTFGFEFELSTPALVVFLAGCGLIIAPLIIGPGEPGGSNRGTVEEGGGAVANGGNSEEESGGDVIATDRQACGGGEEFAFAILDTKVTASKRTVPLRLTNTSDEAALVLSSSVTVANQDGVQVEPLDVQWSPPTNLGPSNSYEGHIELSAESDQPLEEIEVQVKPNGSCPELAAQAAL